MSKPAPLPRDLSTASAIRATPAASTPKWENAVILAGPLNRSAGRALGAKPQRDSGLLDRAGDRSNIRSDHRPTVSDRLTSP